MAIKRGTYWSLFLMGSIYMIGELGHFLLGTVSRSMAQDIHYGDKGCLKEANMDHVKSEVCTDVENESECWNVTAIGSNGTLVPACTWDYTGLGLEYHILAGPAFVAMFTVAGLGWGYFADKFNRVKFLTVAALIFSAAISGTSFATKYWHVLLFRMALGVGESGCSPLASGIIADMFPKSRRGLAMSLFNWGIYIGYGLSYTVGNYVTDANILDKGWRASYMVSGIPGIILAVIFLFTAIEPSRTLSDAENEAITVSVTINIGSETYNETNDGNGVVKYTNKEHSDPHGVAGCVGHGDNSGGGGDLTTARPKVMMDMEEDVTNHGDGSNLTIIQKEKGGNNASGSRWGELLHGLRIGWKIMKNPAMIFLLVGACVRHSAGFCWGYNSALYFKTYYPDYDVSLWLTGISIGAGAAGTLIGGYASDRLVSKLGISARALVLAISQLIASPFAFALFFLEPPLALFSLLAAYIAAEMWFGVMFAILVELVPTDIRSKAVSIVLFCINNVGGNTPVIVDPIANITSYRTAIIILYPGALITSSILFFICWAILRSQKQNK
ncbi:uncharacterized protein LOC118436091 isoform X2 [Folsomia candida]|nr:uncharacterized protein LOC118436091 isoform X2 [Folsomia candida]XP_035709151.1 uncharacterized protein LOC118436091 isoform X2 [Folsomia candida]